MKRNMEQALRFANRIYLMRVGGLGMGAVAVASVLYQNGAHWLAWVAIVVNGFIWPHVALLIAQHSPDPFRAEKRNLIIDSALGGMWVPLMAFNLLPSVMLVCMLSMDKISVGGRRFFARTAAAQLAGCAASVLIFGFDFRPETSMLNIIACLPLLIAYPIAVGMVTYNLSRRVNEQNRLLADLSRTDWLSLLLNRRHWEEAVSSEFRRHRRNGSQACLLMIDIDHFKRVNDSHGHQVGDEVIRKVSEVLRSCLRQPDIAGRYGGEEFGVILPDTHSEGAQAIAKRLLGAVEATLMEREHDIHCTVSIGIAELAADTVEAKHWIGLADRALYRAKDAGRNRIEVFSAVSA